MRGNQLGFNALDLLFEKCDRKATEFQKTLLPSESVLVEINKLVDLVENGCFSTTKEQGDALEKLTKTLFSSLKFFQVLPNLHTSSNEIDFICNLNEQGITALKQDYLEFDKHFLVECKNYNNNINVTHVGKFAALLDIQTKEFGLIISKKRITGSKWDGALGFTKKFYLKTNILIVNFTLDDFKLLNTHSFFEIIHNKKQEIINDVDLTEYLTTHPAML